MEVIKKVTKTEEVLEVEKILCNKCCSAASARSARRAIRGFGDGRCGGTKGAIASRRHRVAAPPRMTSLIDVRHGRSEGA
jgi:hypothetical protein